ncbi:hypothetical protein [Mariniphaga sp.]|uniref:hypothetical protein n=1 Tax=Mariniphaga sp. TaxID=1954475 RepID=UPI00356947D9
MAKKISELNNTEYNSLLNDFYAEPKLRNQLSKDEIKALAEKLNSKIKIPIIGETGEEKILIKIILKIDNFLYENMPNEFYDLVRTTEKGIEKEEAKMIAERLTMLANEKINLPFLSEKVEEKIFRYVIELIVNSAIKKHDLNETLKKPE